MPRTPRLNRIVDLVEQGKPAFGTMVMNGNWDELMYATDADFDFVVVEMEHEGFAPLTLRISLQLLLSRKKLAAGSLQAYPTPLVRVPPNAKELNQWVLKQTLDQGAYGLVLPHVETVEEARHAVAAGRYPQATGAADTEPAGERGWWTRLAPRYWGLSVQEYYDAADTWPADPDGELLLMAIIESAKGIRNLPEILQQVKGIGAVWAGPGDLSIDLGTRGNAADPRVQQGLLEILATCKRFNVPCAVGANTPEEMESRLAQGFRIIFCAPQRSLRALEHGKLLSGR